MSLRMAEGVTGVLTPGSILGVARSVYAHYGVLMDDGKVIHYTSSDSDISGSNVISRTSMNRFLRGKRCFWTMRFPSKEKALRILSARIDRIASEPAGNVSPTLSSLLSVVGRRPLQEGF